MLFFSVIITTHYIEETRRSHKVGFMRRGCLLAEDSPTTLIERFKCSSLEDVFYKLCYTQKTDSQAYKHINLGGSFRRSGGSIRVKSNELNILKQPINKTPSLMTSITQWWSKYNTVSWKILTQTFRQPALITVQFVLPLITLIIFCICVGPTPADVELAIVNEESPPYLSEKYLQFLNPAIIRQKYYDSLESGLEAVKKTKAWGVLHIRQNFSESLIERLNFNEDVDNQTLENSKMSIYADLTNE